MITIIQVDDLKIIYEKQILLNTKDEILNLEKVKIFLDENIYKIEKILNNFIENIYIVLDVEKFSSIYVSIKKNNNNELISSDSLSYALNEAKDQCKKTLENKKIIHMFIEKYLIDTKEYFSFPKNLRCKTFSLDIKFICLPSEFVKNLEEFLKNYQIVMQGILNASYVRDFSQNESNFFLKAHRIVEGCNENEVKFLNKTPKNIGFFEKFFNFFN